jgi:transcriptional regulator with XRE-family HTH domain
MSRGRKKLTAEDFAFAQHVGGKLDEAIEAQDLTRDEAAEKLGIHRSMLFRYLRGQNIPGSKILEKACQELGLSVSFRGLTLDADYFKRTGIVEKLRPAPTQTEFAFMRDSFAGQLARVDIQKKKRATGETLELRMTISLGKAAKMEK